MFGEADLGMTQSAMKEHDRHKGDEHLYVRFFMHPEQDKAKTLEEGRPIFTDQEFIQIMVPGDKNNIVMRAVRDSDKRRFPKQYAAFVNEEKEVVQGTPLSAWNFVSAAQVEELRYFNIRTVEQLANISDNHAQKFMGIQVLKKKAAEFIEASRTDAPIAQLQTELASRDATIAQLQETIEALSARVDAVEEEEVEED